MVQDSGEGEKSTRTKWSRGMPQSQKISIIGNAGGGKSTFCKSIAQKYDIPVYSVDRWQWKPGWVYAGDDHIKVEQDKVLQSESKWVIDGWGPLELIDERFAQSDLILFVDLPLVVHYYWALKRQVTYLFKGDDKKIPGCPMLPMTWTLIKMIGHIDRELKPKLLEILKKHEKQIEIIRINSTKDFKRVLKRFEG